MSEDKPMEFLGQSMGGEPGLMFKVAFTPQGAAIDIAVPKDAEEADMLMQAAAALIVAMALQLGRSRQVCHPQCAFMSIVKGATRELMTTDPEVYRAYCENLMAEASAQGITGGPLGGVPPKKDLH